MAINDRIMQIAKSYINSAIDNIEEGVEEFSKTSKSDLLKNLNNLWKQTESHNDDLSEEEIDKILKEDLQFDSTSYEQAYQRHKSPPKSKKNKDELEEACKKLGVSRDMPLKEIEKAYKTEIRKYHPDRFANDKSKLETATKVSQILTDALETIKKYKK